ncbi:RF2-like protein [Apiospora arundinis]|uniref:RF2-like protein n=1 Tax=Apiospora arundinis TaxID=335852 RepID=A0ABR2JJF2_9PEZI
MARPARRIAGEGVWVVRDSVSGLQLLAAHETCEFRVEALDLSRYEKNTASSARAAKRSLSFQIDTRDIVELIQRGIRRFERRGRVGVWGIIRCEGTTYGDREVVWSIYHSPGRVTRPGPLGDIILGIAGAIPDDAGTIYPHSTGTKHGSR